jgi:hypothetical protein
MFHDWENFYLIVGSAAGALIGLMFVVVTLTAGLEPSRVSRGAQVYITPIVFHFAIVVVVSAIAVVPELPPREVSVILLLAAAIGFAYSAATAIRIFRLGWAETHWSDKYFYGILPAIAYVGLAGAACAVWLAPRPAAFAVAATVLAVLLLGIRDAWDLATSIVNSARDRRG